MERAVREQFAHLLRAAASRTIPEEVFWLQFEGLFGPVHEPVVDLAYESATHYWGEFHARNLLLMPVKPNQGQLIQGQNELNLIADALLGDWPIQELKKRLKDI